MSSIKIKVEVTNSHAVTPGGYYGPVASYDVTVYLSVGGDSVIDVYTETVIMDPSRNYDYTMGGTYISENADVERLVVEHFGKKLTSLLATYTVVTAPVL